MAKTLDQVVGKWKADAEAAGPAWLTGVQGTTVDPTALAAQNSAGYLAGVQLAVSSGLWARKLQAVGKTGWLTACEAKQGNYATGITAGADKFQSAMTTWLPIIQSTAATAKAMPGQTIQQRIARSAYVQQTLYNRKRGL